MSVQPPEPVRRPSTLGGLVYLLVVALAAVGLAVMAFGPWRRGVVVVGIAMLIGAVTRLTLGELRAGMLRVRSRWFDVTALTGVGIVLLVLAKVIPNQHV